jgi:predicted enzyme related to lactoylglutathione lyase
MKKLHIHISVPDLPQSIQFYNSLFGCEPSKEKADYAKWELEDPRVNFAISTRSQTMGLDHLGIQVEEESEINEINNRLKQASQLSGEINKGICCYSESSKSWTVDKAGIPWESFMTMQDAEVYGTDSLNADGSACCVAEPSTAKTSCC